jgi:MbtH protein
MSQDNDQTIYKVVLNHELQYSIWPEYRELPLGWNEVGVAGLKEVCLDHIETVWEDMRPTSVRIHMERLERLKKDSGETPPVLPSNDEPQELATLVGFKVADKDGRSFFDPTLQFVVGETLTVESFDDTPHYGGGFHFSQYLEDAVANGVAAAVWSDRYFPELQGELYSSKTLHTDGIKILQIQARRVVQVTDSVRKAHELTVVKEVDLDKSRLWPLLKSYVEWQESQLEPVG